MSLHISELKGSLYSFFAELGLVETEARHDERSDLPQLTLEQELLIQCYQSGQIEHWAWEQHLDHDRVLAAHFRTSAPN